MAHPHSIRRLSVPMKERRFSILIYPFLPYSFSSTPKKSFNLPGAWPSKNHRLNRGNGLFQGFSMTSCFGTQGAQLQGHHCSGQAPWAERNPDPLKRTDSTDPRFASIFRGAEDFHVTGISAMLTSQEDRRPPENLNLSRPPQFSKTRLQQNPLQPVWCK